MVILVSDGESADLFGGNDETVARTLRRHDITVYAIHIGAGVGRPPFRHTVIVGWNHCPSPISATRCRIHQATSSFVVTPGTTMRFENASTMIW